MRKRASVQETIVAEAAAELHAAALAVLLHLGHTEVLEAVEAYRARVLSRYHAVPQISEKVEAQLADVDRRAKRQASELEKGLYANQLQRIGQGRANQDRSLERNDIMNGNHGQGKVLSAIAVDI